MDQAKLFLTAIIVAVAVSAAISVSRPSRVPLSTPGVALTASLRTTDSAPFVDLRWSGPANQGVDVYRNGSRLATVSSASTYVDRLDARLNGTFTYKVCLAGTSTCSSDATVPRLRPRALP